MSTQRQETDRANKIWQAVTALLTPGSGWWFIAEKMDAEIARLTTKINDGKCEDHVDYLASTKLRTALVELRAYPQEQYDMQIRMREKKAAQLPPASDDVMQREREALIEFAEVGPDSRITE
jgi:hypothetical protein